METLQYKTLSNGISIYSTNERYLTQPYPKQLKLPNRLTLINCQFRTGLAYKPINCILFLKKMSQNAPLHSSLQILLGILMLPPLLLTNTPSQPHHATQFSSRLPGLLYTLLSRKAQLEDSSNPTKNFSDDQQSNFERSPFRAYTTLKCTEKLVFLLTCRLQIPLKKDLNTTLFSCS